MMDEVVSRLKVFMEDEARPGAMDCECNMLFFVFFITV